MDWAMQEKSYSQRRACSLAGIDPRVYRRKPSPDGDAKLRDRMKELAAERRRPSRASGEHSVIAACTSC